MKFVSGLSAALWLAMVAFVIISETQSHNLRWHRIGRTMTLASTEGGILLDSKAQPPIALPTFQYDVHVSFKRIDTTEWCTTYGELFGFWFAKGTTPFGSRWMISMPYWFPVLVFAVLPVVQLYRFSLGWRERRRVGFAVIPKNPQK